MTSDVGSDNLLQSDLFGHERGAFTGASAPKQGLFSLADGGTIFLDEIGDASPELQARLLRVLESRRFRRLGGVRDIEVDVRVIAATNRNLKVMMEQGTFRSDLFFRLNVIPVHLPPLRERAEDIPELAQLLLARAGHSKRYVPLPPALADRLDAYSWPGNIRELDHALKHAQALAEGTELTAADFPPEVEQALRDPLVEYELGPAPAMPRRSATSPLVDLQALRDTLRAHGDVPPSALPPDLPGHIEQIKRMWLGVLIDELGGDLSRIAYYWDRGSEKTLRNLIRAYGLTEELASARARSREVSRLRN